MPTTAEMLLKIADCLLVARYGLSSAAGTTATLVDAALTEPDDYFNGGTIWFITGPLAGKTATITTWDLPTHTFTFPAQTVAPGAGSQYAVLDERYPRDMLVGALNSALSSLGPFDGYDDTLVTVADQRVYTLPTGVADVKRVQYSNETATPYTYGPCDRWWVVRDGKLYLSPNHLVSADHHIRLWYGKPHARVYLDADVVTDAVHPERIAWQAAWNATRARNARAETIDPATEKLEQKVIGMVQLMAREHPVERMGRDSVWIDL